MSLKRNELANYIGQTYGGVIGIVMLPVYVRYMGAEAYGLMAFRRTGRDLCEPSGSGAVLPNTECLCRQVPCFPAGCQ
jgi:hypothetical protein